FVPSISLAGYLAALLGVTALTIGAPAFLTGLVFPLLFSEARALGQTGRALGRLTAVNTVGSIAGSLAAGFVLLPAIGLWWSVAAISLVYSAAAVALRAPRARTAGAAAALAAILAAILLGSQRLRPGETVEWKAESRAGLIAVVRSGGDLSLRADNFYELGSSRYADREVRQGLIPLLLHPAPKRVLYVGLATGI